MFYIHMNIMVNILSVIVPAVFLFCAGQRVYGNTNTCSSFCSTLGNSSLTPGKSCANIYQINKAARGNSGLYWIETTSSNGSVQVYCDMELECGGHKGGWMRIAKFDTIVRETHAHLTGIECQRSRKYGHLSSARKSV